MAHDNNGRIYIDTNTTGVEIADVQAVLDLTNTDIGALITQGASQSRINKWAKCKPVRYYTFDTVNQQKVPYFGLLTGDMWKGAVIEQNQGAYYGIEVHIAGDQQVTQEMNTWPLLHDTTFVYRVPRGLSESEIFRLRDFEEYRQKARPNPDSSFTNEDSATGYVNNPLGISGITVRYYDPNPPQGQTGNEWGVDLTGVLIDPSYSTTSALQNTYPCIIVGKGNTHYITALGYEDDPAHFPRPVYYHGAYVGGTWIADTSKPVYGTQSANGPWTSPQTGLVATLVLLRSAKSGGIYLDAMGSQNLATHWFECTGTILTNVTPVPLPGGCGVGLSLVAYANGITVSATGISYDSSLQRITVPLSWTGTPVGDGSFSALVSVELIPTGAHSGNSASQTVRGSVSLGIRNAIFTPGDFQITPNPLQPRTYDVSITVTTTDGTATNVATLQDITVSI